jgi:hypothetical protein
MESEDWSYSESQGQVSIMYTGGLLRLYGTVYWIYGCSGAVLTRYYSTSDPYRLHAH